MPNIRKKKDNSDPENHNIVAIALITACCLLGDSMLYIALPIYWREVGLDAIWQVGVLLAVNRFVRLPLNPLVGKIYEKISLKTGLIFAVGLSVITTVGYGLATGFIAWLLLRCLWGLAWSFLRIGGLTAVALYSERESQGQSMGLYNGLYRLGSLVGMLVGGLLTPIFGLSLITIAFGFLSGAGSMLLMAYVKQSSKTKAQVPPGPKRGFFDFRLLREHKLVFSSGFLITFLIQGVFTSTLSSLIVFHYGEYVQFWQAFLAAATLSGLLQALRWMWEPFLARKIGQWSDRKKGRIPLFVGALCIGSVGFILMPFSFPPFVWIVITIIVLLACTALTTLNDALAADRAREDQPVRFFTHYTVVQDLGAACGPIVGFTILSLIYGYEMLYVGCGVIMLILGGIWVFKYLQMKNRRLITTT